MRRTFRFGPAPKSRRSDQRLLWARSVGLATTEILEAMIYDTDPDVQERWVKLQRERSPTEQFNRALEMTMLVRSMFAANLRREDPTITQREIHRRIVAAYYGEECAVRAYGATPER